MVVSENVSSLRRLIRICGFGPLEFLSVTISSAQRDCTRDEGRSLGSVRAWG